MGPPPPPPQYYHHHNHNAGGTGGHIARLASKSLHLRSQSLPEAVYLAQQQKQQQQQQQQQQQREPRVVLKQRSRHPSQNQTASQQPQIVHHHVNGLRRSHTNVADFSSVRRVYAVNAPSHHGQMASQFAGGQPRYHDMPGLFTARSRSNVAALGLNPEAVYRPSSGHCRSGRSGGGISRATSFYHHNRSDHHRSMGYLTSHGPPPPLLPTSGFHLSRSSLALSTAAQNPVKKDLSQPLHVDCSVEYDLGSQPKIPEDSAPLLIIHPAYQQQRFHPYSNSSSSTTPISEVEHKTKSTSSGQGTSVTSSLSSASTAASSSKSNNNNLSKLLPPGHKYPPTLGGGNRVVRHSSFMVTTPPKMGAARRQTSHLLYQNINEAMPSAKRLSIASDRGAGLFHLSMPDITGEGEEPSSLDHDVSKTAPPRQWTHNKKAQHRHHHSQAPHQAPPPSNPRARQNLNPKLEAVRKLSADSGGVASSSSSSGGGSSLAELNRVFLGGGVALSNNNCDSGLGTPSSFTEASSSEVASKNSSSGLSKWKSSMSGKTRVHVILIRFLFLICVWKPKHLI